MRQRLVVGDGAHEAHDAHHDRPDGDEVEHEQRAEAGPAQDGQPREDADQAPRELPAPGAVAAGRPEGTKDVDHAIEQGEQPPQEDQRAERDARPGQGEHAEHHAQHALQQHQPPMVTKRSDDRVHDVPPDCCGKTDEAGRLRPLTGERVCVPLSTLGDVGREYSGPKARTSARKRSCDLHAAVAAPKERAERILSRSLLLAKVAAPFAGPRARLWAAVLLLHTA